MRLLQLVLTLLDVFPYVVDLFGSVTYQKPFPFVLSYTSSIPESKF